MLLPSWLVHVLAWTALVPALLGLVLVSLWLSTAAVRAVLIHLGHWQAFCGWYYERATTRRRARKGGAP